MKCMRILSPEKVRPSGRLAGLINAVTEARYLSSAAENEILPETIEAFRNRVDDRLERNKGLWQGEFWGKWMLGAVSAYRHSGNSKLLSLIRRSVKELMATADANGYIGTYHDSSFGQSAESIFEWNIWCRKYTLWGLVEAYEVLGDDEILQTARRFMDHLAGQVGPGGFDIRLTGAKYGLPSTSLIVPVLRLYNHTRNPAHLDYARYIVDQWSLLEGQPPDILRKGLSGRNVTDWFPAMGTWAKAYEFISCVEGLVDLYSITGTEDYLTCAQNIFTSIRETDRHITGGLGNSDTLEYSRFMVQAPSEVCDAVHWVRLAVQLLQITGRKLYADEIERTLYNIFMAATGLDPAWGTRRLLLYGAHYVAPGHCQLKHHHCCVANLPRGLYQVLQTAVMESDKGPVIQLFIPGIYDISVSGKKDMTISIKTDYPEKSPVRVTVKASEPVECDISFRIPGWSADPDIRLNGKQLKTAGKNGYARISRTWNNEDTVTLDFDMTARITPLPSRERCPAQPFTAVERGPLVLARDIRLGDSNIHEPVLFDADDNGRIDLTPKEKPENVWLAFETALKPAAGRSLSAISLCDYSSAGNTWDIETSDFRVWLPVDKRNPMK